MNYKTNRDYKRVYPADIWKWFRSNEVFEITDSNGCKTKHLLRHLEEFFIKHTLKNGYLHKNKDRLYVETYNPRYGSITDNYIVVPKKVG